MKPSKRRSAAVACRIQHSKSNNKSKRTKGGIPPITTHASVSSSTSSANRHKQHGGHPHDCLLGRGHSLWPGNRRYREIIARHRHAYATASKNKEKMVITSRIVQEVQQDGGRFLKEDAVSGKLLEVSLASARLRVGQALRHQLRSTSGDDAIDDECPESPPTKHASTTSSSLVSSSSNDDHTSSTSTTTEDHEEEPQHQRQELLTEAPVLPDMPMSQQWQDEMMIVSSASLFNFTEQTSSNTAAPSSTATRTSNILDADDNNDDVDAAFEDSVQEILIVLDDDDDDEETDGNTSNNMSCSDKDMIMPDQALVPTDKDMVVDDEALSPIPVTSLSACLTGSSNFCSTSSTALFHEVTTTTTTASTTAADSSPLSIPHTPVVLPDGVFSDEEPLLLDGNAPMLSVDFWEEADQERPLATRILPVLLSDSSSVGSASSSSSP